MSFKHKLLLGFIYFLILFFISLFVKDVSNQYDNLTLITPNELLKLYEKLAFLTPFEVLKSTLYGDPATFMKTAIEIARDGWITSSNQWVFNLWPPGFILLEALIIKLFGVDAPIILILQILVSLLFSIVFISVYIIAVKYINKKLAFLLPMSIFIFPVSRVFILEPLGISFGEGLSIGFFLLFVTFSIISVSRDSKSIALLAGVFLGLSAYFRSQFETILMIATIFGILLIAISIVYQLFKNSRLLEKCVITQIAIIVFGAFIVTLPWRIYNYAHNDRTSWVASTSLTYANLVRTSEKLHSLGGNWIVEGRGNMVCLVNNDTCGKVKESNMALLAKTFIESPLKWYSIKAEVIGKYWFAVIDSRWDMSTLPTTYNSDIINWSILLMFIYIMYMTIKNIKEKLVMLLTWINLSVFSTYAMIFTIIHYEVRYFFFPKIFIIFMFLLFLIISRKEKVRKVS